MTTFPQVVTLRGVDLPRPDIQFATTEDHVGIAHWELGSGLPLIVTHNWSLSHAEQEWQIPSIASLLVALSERYRVIRFDPRGQGLSDALSMRAGVSSTGALRGLSEQELGLDVAAVAMACGVERFALLAVMSQAPVAITYAANHPDRLIGLILCDAVAKIESSFLDLAIQTQTAVAQLEATAGSSIGVTPFARLAPPDELAAWTDLNRVGSEGETYIPSTIAMSEWDSSKRLGEVETPTLILTSRNPSLDFLTESRKLAASISNSQLRIVDGTFAPYVADRVAVLDAITDLLDNADVPEIDGATSGFRTVAFTDIIGSTEFVSRVGDEEGRAAIRHIEAKVADLATVHAGRIVKNLGDGSLISFASNTAALTFAIELQSQIEEGQLQLRVGMAAGEPIQEDGDIHGAVVVQASRIADLAQAGEVVVSEGVHQLAVGKGFEFEAAGEVTLKGFDQPTTVWRVAL